MRSDKQTRTANTVLWILQGLLAALFLFAGIMKLVTPIAAMAQQARLPASFLIFIGVVEILGAIGLVLPWLLRIRPILTPLAALGLTIIMVGATILSVVRGDFAPALIPLVVALLLAFVGYRRYSISL